jgi:hypothetical protein
MKSPSQPNCPPGNADPAHPKFFDYRCSNEWRSRTGEPPCKFSYQGALAG